MWQCWCYWRCWCDDERGGSSDDNDGDDDGHGVSDSSGSTCNTNIVVGGTISGGVDNVGLRVLVVEMIVQSCGCFLLVMVLLVGVVVVLRIGVRMQMSWDTT